MLGLVWHLHQPFFIPDREVQRRARESYRPLLRAHIDQEVPLVVNVTGSLLERLVELAPEVVDDLQVLADRGNLELLGSAFHHPVLPLLGRSHVREQLRRDRAVKRAALGTEPVGFWPTELAWSHQLVPQLVEAGYEWAVVDSVALSAGTSVPTWETTEYAGETVLEPDLTVAAADRELHGSYRAACGQHEIDVVLRHHSLSRGLVDPEVGVLSDPERLPTFVDSLADADAETSGHVLVGGDGERVRPGTIHTYRRLLSRIRTRAGLEIGSAVHEAADDERFLPATTFQGGLAPWASTMEDYTYLLRLVRLEERCTLARAVADLGARGQEIGRAEEALLKAEDSSCVFWRYTPRARLAGHAALAEAASRLDSVFGGEYD
jgi:alpha-amylase/alpha-mannosidase (GH57 family)